MKYLLTRSIILLLAVGWTSAVGAHGDFVIDRDSTTVFATLPDGPGHPEGIAADRFGNIYVATFEFSGSNVIHVFGRNGHPLVTIPLAADVLPLGMEFDSAGNLYVADFGNGQVLKFSPPFTAASMPSASFPVCAGGAGAGCGLNAIAFDKTGDLYVSDSFGGNIFKVDLPGGVVSTFFSDEGLQPGNHGFPGFGANGLAFDADGANLYVANTADDRVFRLELDANGNPSILHAFAESVNGADGIVFDGEGTLWVAANQADEIVGLNANGRVVARLGEFQGIRKDGSAKGLLFPASPAIVGDELFVTNLALGLTGIAGNEPEADVTRFTVSRIKLPHH